MRPRVACLVLAAGLALPGVAAAAGFRAGAARVVTTPPRAGTPEGRAADARFGPPATACSAAQYPDRGRFALQEPFADTNGNGQWDEDGDGGGPEPFCDANGNGRWDGLYSDGRGPVTGVHDDIDARAFAVGHGSGPPVVYASVEQIGLFDFYTEQARAALARTYNVHADLVVSADHNESSPDSIGLYGPYQTDLGVGLRSGIDEYYMRYLEDAIARAAANAVHRMRPARLFAAQVIGGLPAVPRGKSHPLLRGLSERLSTQFPTTVALPGDDRIAAIDPKAGVLQARTPAGRPIFTVLSVAAHNQEMGNSGAELSGDWPGAFARSFDARHPGVALFLVGDNGSEEDPETEPPVIPDGSENHKSVALQYQQASATGARFATLAAAAARAAQPLRPGPVRLVREQTCVPLENNGFVALAATGEFGLRQGYQCDADGRPVRPVPNGGVLPTTSTQFRTFVAHTDIGPDLQLLDNPGESFPALMLGSPFGPEDESCDAPNPAVPTWHARAPFRFQVGLADDLIGYLIPAWGFASEQAGLFRGGCANDMHGHKHKLESESVGPTGANDVANALAALLDRERDPSARVVRGRFVGADGTPSRWAEGAAGVRLADGTLVGGPAVAGFGARAVDATGFFMDYDGQPQARADITTRGMVLVGPGGCVLRRFYLNVFPTLDVPRVGRAVPGPGVAPATPCGRPGALQGLAAARAGLPVPAADAALARRAGPFAPGRFVVPCPRRPRAPVLRITRVRGSVLVGTARAFGCAGRRAVIARVSVRAPGASAVLAHGRARWSVRQPAGGRPLLITAVDSFGRAVTLRRS